MNVKPLYITLYSCIAPQIRERDIKMSKNEVQAPYTTLIVRENGVGKTSVVFELTPDVLLLIINIS